MPIPVFVMFSDDTVNDPPKNPLPPIPTPPRTIKAPDCVLVDCVESSMLRELVSVLGGPT